MSTFTASWLPAIKADIVAWRKNHPRPEQTEMKRLAAMDADGLLENHEYRYFLNPPRKKPKPSLFKTIKQVRAAGIDKGTVTVGEVSVTFGESDPTAAASDWPLTDFTRVKQ